jgi:molecular chaperone GrpE
MQDIEKQEAQTAQQDAPVDQAATAEAAPAEPTLEDKLAAAEAKAAEMQDAFLRARADGENIRRRAQEDIAKAHKFAIEGFAESLLAVKDSLEMALKIENASLESLKEGVDMTLKQLSSAFEKNKLQKSAASRREAGPDEAPGRLGRAGRARPQYGRGRAAKAT